MTGRSQLIAIAGAVLALLYAMAPSAAAQPEDEGSGGGAGSGTSATSATLHVEARPLFGPSSLTPGGFGEVLVRIANTGTAKATGEVQIATSGYSWRGGSKEADRSRAPFSVAPGSTISLRIPTRVGDHDDPLLQVTDGQSRKIHEQNLRRAGGYEALLVDVSRASALGAALRGMPVAARNDPFASPFSSRGYGGGATPMTLSVAAAPYDPATGDPVMPERTAAYGQVAALLMHSDELSRVSDREIEALVGYLLAGGTLAIVVARPEDLRAPTLVAMLGGEATAGPAHEQTLRALVVGSPAGPAVPFGTPPSKALPKAAAPKADVADDLVGYSGGNLRPSFYGSSAPYGLGEVHLLAFDPTAKPAVDSPWVQLRMVDLVRRATERRSSVLFPPGGYHNLAETIRRQLDPNEGSRWAIVLAALLLCVYSVVAGPINFAFWRKRGRPLRALLYLPLLSGATFVLVVTTGIFAKGCSGRARHLTVAEAGAGMTRATARRWRGFFVPNARKLTVPTRHASSVVSTARMDLSEPSQDRLLVDRDSARLEELELRPWQTVVVREDGFVDLGEGISMIAAGKGEVTVANHCGHNLRGLVLRPAGAPALRWLPHLDAGASASSKTFTVLPGSGLSSRMTTAGMTLYDFDVFAMTDELEGVSSGLADAWQAVSSVALGESSWFPDDVPVLLAQIDGGEGQQSDSGLGLDSDRLLVRVVGYGGMP